MDDFLTAATELIRKRAADVDPEDYGFVDFAAHLFAVASQLHLSHGSARLADWSTPPSKFESVPEMLAQLSELPDGIGAPDLYLQLINALLTVQDELSRRPLKDVKALRGWTDLADLPLGAGRRLAGRVYSWMRPERMALPRQRDQRYDAAENPPPDPVPHPITYLHRLAFYWDSDPQLPLVVPPPRTDRTVHLIEESGRDVSEGGGFRIALCPLEGVAHPLFTVDPGGRHFRIRQPGGRGVKDSQSLRSTLEELLRAAREDDVHLLVLPELTVDRCTRKRLSRLLRSAASVPPYGILAGSFHIWNRRKASPINEARLLDHTGAVLLSHRKRGRFRLNRKAFQDETQREMFSHLFSGAIPADLGKEIVEDIEWGSRLEILETSLGRLAVLICADGIARDAEHSYIPVICRVRPDLLLVVSMSPETRPFEELIETLSGYRIGTIFVNAHCICEPLKKGPLLAACNLALFEPEGAPPTRLRWRLGDTTPECISFSDKKGWREAKGEETGAYLWEKDGRRLGLIVDLGVHWRKREREEKIPS